MKLCCVEEFLQRCRGSGGAAAYSSCCCRVQRGVCKSKAHTRTHRRGRKGGRERTISELEGGWLQQLQHKCIPPSSNRMHFLPEWH